MTHLRITRRNPFNPFPVEFTLDRDQCTPNELYIWGILASRAEGSLLILTHQASLDNTVTYQLVD